MLRSEGAHEEGGIREWNIRTTGFTGDEQGHVRQVAWRAAGARAGFRAVEGGEFTLDAELVLIAIGFCRAGARGPAGTTIAGARSARDLLPPMKRLHDLNAEGIFVAGDMRRGQSLVVWAIAEGRKAAAAIDSYLARTGTVEPGRLGNGRGDVVVESRRFCDGAFAGRMSTFAAFAFVLYNRSTVQPESWPSG